MNNNTPYPAPDELDALIDQAQMSPDQEAWCVMAVMDYRLVCQQVALALHHKKFLEERI